MKLTCAIVDDDPLIVEYVRTVLSENPDLELHGFTSSPECAAFLESNRTHIVVADVVMPQLDGIDLIDRAKLADPMTQLIMITAYSTVGRVVVSLRHGACDFVLKPFHTPDELVGSVEACIARWNRWLAVIKQTAALDSESPQ